MVATLLLDLLEVVATELDDLLEEVTATELDDLLVEVAATELDDLLLEVAGVELGVDELVELPPQTAEVRVAPFLPTPATVANLSFTHWGVIGE